MGSIITLGIDEFELDWGKNGISRDYSFIYQKADLTQEKYYYADEEIVVQEALSSPLSKIKKRLDLLGYTLKNIKKEYIEAAKEYSEGCDVKVPLSFEQYFKILRNLDIDKIKVTELDLDWQDCEFGKYFKKVIARKLNILDINTWNIYVGEFFENLDPLITIRVLAENPKNHTRKIIWRFHDVLENGWIKKDDVLKEPKESQKYLLVTEGTSDLFIIQKSLELLHPEIIDFFHFIDMQDNYPFTGCSNLYKFLLGLSKVRPINKIIAIFDNDIAGNKQFRLSEKAKLPDNIKIMKLPELNEFKKFPTIGPTGLKIKNINSTAVSIECFLDLEYKAPVSPLVRWTNFDKETALYQGSLEKKERYVRNFKKVKLKSKYNFIKIKTLCNFIIDSCIGLNKNC